jgi:hypothetical protein
MSEAWQKVGNIQGPAGPPGAAGGMNWVVNESHATNGTTTLFTTAQVFIAGSLIVYLNGLRQVKPNDYSETTTQSFTMTTPPLATDTLLVDYIL